MTVYAVEMTSVSCIKVGFVQPGGLRARMAMLQTGAPYRLWLHGGFRDRGMDYERPLHELLRPECRPAMLKLRGEWFSPTDEALEILREQPGWNRLGDPVPAQFGVSFWDWLTTQRGRDTCFGDLADDLIRDVDRFLPVPIYANDFDSWYTYLEDHCSWHGPFCSLRDAHSQWVRMWTQA